MSGINDWKYYNHAAIPTCAPNEKPDLKPIMNGTIWKMYGFPLFARYTNGFDLIHKKDFWYLVRLAPYNLSQLSKKSIKSIKYGLNHCEIQRIDPNQYLEELFLVYLEAVRRYEKCIPFNKEEFVSYIKQNEKCDYWIAQNDENRVIAYISVEINKCYVEIKQAKFSPKYLHLKASDALYHTVLDFYLNDLHKEYISSGTRCVNHVTNTQEYKIKKFHYQKAYCDLIIVYRPFVRLLVRILYCFKNILKEYDSVNIIHNINSVLEMESIARNCAKSEAN